MSLSRLLTLFFACGLLGSVTIATAFDWPQWRGPKRDDHSPQTNMNKDWAAKPPKLQWKIEGMGKGYASVAIVGDGLYTTGNFGNGQAVVAVDLKTQKVIWSTPVTDSDPKHGYDGSRTTPAIDGDRLYVIPSNGAIACLNLADGSIRWKKDFKQQWDGKMMSGWGFSESPLVDGDLVLCTPGSEKSMMVALNKLTGDEVWSCKVPDFGTAGKQGAGYSSIVISNAGGLKQYVQFVGRGIIGVNAKSGELLWTYNRVANGTANIPTPIPSGDYIFTSSGYGDGGSALLKLIRKGNDVEAQEVYYKKNSEIQNHHGGMILVGDHVYMGHGHNNGFPMCVNLLSGDIAWGGKIRGEGKGSAAVTYADGHIIFRYQSGEIALVEATPADYRLKGTFKPEVANDPCWAHPVVCNGKLYLRDQNTLMVYDVAGK